MPLGRFFSKNCHKQNLPAADWKIQSTRVMNSSNTPFEIQIFEFKGTGAIWQNGLWSD